MRGLDGWTARMYAPMDWALKALIKHPTGCEELLDRIDHHRKHP